MSRAIGIEVPRSGAGRDRYIDFLRTGSLLVVVAWHWLFNVVRWQADGPHLSNPIGATKGFWALTWFFQVLPVFFVAGGFSHLVSWQSTRRAGGGYRQFVGKRMRRLLTPVAACLAAAGVAWWVLSMLLPRVGWFFRAIYLMLSPLWFLGVYLVMVLLTPAAAWLHRRWGMAVPVAMVVLVAAVDVARFRYRLGVEWANLLLVWGLAHQLGFFWKGLIAAPRRTAWAMAASGLIALVALTGLGPYPRSMVGVPGEAISNMAPPTLCIVALAVLQLGIVLLVREPVGRWLAHDRPERFTRWAGGHAMTLYLWHFPGFAMAYALVWSVGIRVPQRPDSVWWMQRPLWAVLPALFTVPLVAIFHRFERR